MWYQRGTKTFADPSTYLKFSNGGFVAGIGKTPPEMLRVAGRVRKTVNEEIKRRIKDFQPKGEKLKFQSPDEWKPNASFVNCYAGGHESVGWHSDHLTYLGPRAVIGSLSLGKYLMGKTRLMSETWG